MSAKQNKGKNKGAYTLRAEYSGAERRGVHMQAERSGATDQSLWRILCIPAAGCVKNKRKHWVHPNNSEKKNYGEFLHLFEELRRDESRVFSYLRIKPATFGS